MKKQYDLVVIGGGPSGVAAAVSAARKGISVLLVEQAGMLGGMGTSGLVTVLMASLQWFGGMGKEIIEKLMAEGSAYYIANPQVKGFRYYPYDAEAMKRTLDEMVLDSGAELLLYTTLCGVQKDNGHITSVTLSGVEGEITVSAKTFVDASGDAALCRMAGETVAYGAEDGSIQAPTMISYYTGIDFDRYEAFLSTFDDGNGVPKIKMIHSLVPKAVEDGVLSECDFHHPGVFRINESENVGMMNVGHVYGADCSDSAGLTAATLRGRKMAKQYLDFYRKYIPGFENAYLAATGSRLSLRETYRLEGRYITTFEDKTNYAKFEDAIMRFDGGAVSDLHSSSSDKKAYQAYVSLYAGRENVRRDDFATLPYRSLQAACTDNLLVAGRCVSADRKTVGQIRLMSYCYSMGQAAGLASALAVQNGVLPGDIDVRALQAELRAVGVETV